jgi:carbamoyltransferase
MKLLGMMLQPHDASISYYDGKCIRYLKTERLKHQKHHSYDNLWEWREDIKTAWGLDYRDVDEIAYIAYHSPISPFINQYENLYSDYDYFPAPIKTWCLNHHYAHALSHYGSIDPDVSIVIDGEGEPNIAWTVFKNNKIVEYALVSSCGSVGDRYNEAGRTIGVTSENSLDIAGKTMGVQSYGKFDVEFYRSLSDLSIYDINRIYDWKRWVSHIGCELLADIRRIDWVKTIHVKTGEAILGLFKKHCKPDDIIYYSGGVAQNVLWNTTLKKHFKNLIIYPHVADDGCSLGAVEFLRKKNNLPQVPINNFPFCVYDESPTSQPSYDTISKAAQYLSEGKIVAWYQGHGEMGFRALGNRSILMDPRIQDGKSRINAVKRRENYRPFGASILSEHKDIYFDIPFENEYMLYVGECKTDSFPAITHIDNTSRIQTVGKIDNPFRTLLEKFNEITGCPVLLNTSLNLAGKPIAGSILEAHQLYTDTKIDVLVVGNDIYTKQ